MVGVGAQNLETSKHSFYNSSWPIMRYTMTHDRLLASCLAWQSFTFVTQVPFYDIFLPCMAKILHGTNSKLPLSGAPLSCWCCPYAPQGFIRFMLLQGQVRRQHEREQSFVEVSPANLMSKKSKLRIKSHKCLWSIASSQKQRQAWAVGLKVCPKGANLWSPGCFCISMARASAQSSILPDISILVTWA